MIKNLSISFVLFSQLFLKGMPHLHSRMRRITGKDEKPPIDQEDEPDLYRISQLFPVPPPTVSSSTKLPEVITPGTSACGRSDIKSNSHDIPSYDNMFPSQSSCSEERTPTLPNKSHTALDVAVSASAFNLYVALAGQARQVSAQQQSYMQLLSAAASLNFHSGIMPSYAQQMNALSQQQFQHQYNLACLSSFLRGSVRGTAATATGQPAVTAADAEVESPVMFIPVYPSTLAAFGASRRPL
jgi:hypothetical protein